MPPLGSRILIVLFLAGLSNASWGGHAQAKEIGENTQTGREIRRCVSVPLDGAVARSIGYALKRTKWRGYEFSDEHPVTIQPRMAGMMGPSVTLLGRDARLAVTMRQTSPQELWHKAQWNAVRVDGCTPGKVRSVKQFLKALYWTMRLDIQAGHSAHRPSVLYRTRAVTEAFFARPYGFVFGASVAAPLADNTSALLALPDMRAPVRRDVARFSNGPGVDRLFASWRTTPVSDVHVALNAGWLEEMYGGGGIEVVWRPFGSAFWAGADAWHVWRRDATSTLHMDFDDGADTTTGHVRVGYDIPDTRAGVQVAAGKYLGDDWGATVSMRQVFDSGLTLEAAMTWTERREMVGFGDDTRIDPSVRVTLPLWGPGSHRETRMTLRQLGRDAGQMLDRPLPLERMTEPFSAREIGREWPRMFD